MLEALADELWIAWQPIYNLRSGSIWGHEALIRGPKGQPFETPQELFELARREGVEEQFEVRCRELAFESAARDLAHPGVLFVNADPRFVGTPMLPVGGAWLASRTVVEVSESSPLFDDPQALQVQVAEWRRQGCRIALDDYGSGFAGQTALLALRPDVVKIDRLLTCGIDSDNWRQEIVSATVHMCSDLGVAVIAEGIETPEELNELLARGVSLGQGFLLGSPGRRPSRERLSVRALYPDPPEPAGDPDVDQGLPRFAVDPSRRIVSWSAEATELTGRSAQSVVGMACWLSGVDHRDAEGHRLCFRACPLVTAMQTGSPQEATVYLRTASGKRERMTVRAHPILGRRGEVVGAVESFVPQSLARRGPPSIVGG